MTLALVLSGGGARGAYEVGVLSYVMGDLVARRGPPPIALISGTSVGAINGAFVASSLHDPVDGARRLEAMWREITLPNVLGFNVLQAKRLHRVLLGGRRGAGLFDATPMTEIIRTGIDYRQLARNLRRGLLKAVTITATHVRTGQPVCFVDCGPGGDLPRGMSASVIVQPAHIMPHHVLASAAIPVAFPPVSIRTDLYCDGGLRLNTPLSPVIHLGAERVFVIGLSAETPATPIQPGRYPGLPYLLGKVLDAFMLDHVNLDLEDLRRLNALLADGEAAFGPDFTARLNAAAEARGGVARRKVSPFVIRPSVDLGMVAADFLRTQRALLSKQLGRTILRMIDVGEGAQSADLASYLLFDGGFADQLIALGRRDAEAQGTEIEAFLYSDHLIPKAGDNHAQTVDKLR